MAGDPIPYCSECGEEVPADSRFCPECGASLGGERGPERSRRRSKTSIDIDENLEAALTYLLGWITGIIFLLLEKQYLRK